MAIKNAELMTATRRVSNVRLRLDLSTTLADARFGRDDGVDGTALLCLIRKVTHT